MSTSPLPPPNARPERCTSATARVHPTVFLSPSALEALRAENVEDAPRRKSARGGACEEDQGRESPLSRPLAPPHPKCYPSPRFLWPTFLQHLTTQAPGDQTSLMYPPQPPSLPSPPRRQPRGAGLPSLLNNPPYLPKSRPHHPSARPGFPPAFLFRRHSIRPAMHSINLQSNSIDLNQVQSTSINLRSTSINIQSTPPLIPEESGIQRGKAVRWASPHPHPTPWCNLWPSPKSPIPKGFILDSPIPL